MPVPYKPLAIANEFIVKSGDNGVSHMKVQKLTYFSYGWWLAYNDTPILNEAPQVWQHGPVFNSLYHALSGHGWRNINTVQNDNFMSDAPRVDDGCKTKSLIDWVWDRYGGYGAEYLSDITHQKGTPWETTAASFKYRVPRGTAIPSEVIKNHFEELAIKYGFNDENRI